MIQTGKVLNWIKEFSFFLPLSALLLFGIIQYSDNQLLDFANYYFGGYFQLKGELKSWIYSPVTFNQEIENAGINHVFASFSPNPPSLAYLFQVFAFLAPQTSKLLFNILGSLLFLGFCFRWFRFFGIDFRLALLIPILFYKPIMANLYQGQLYFFVVILLLEGFIALKKKRFLLFSSLWAIAVFIKLFPIILGLYILSTKQLRATIWFGSVLILSFGTLVLLQGTTIWSTFIFEILPQVSKGEVIDSYAVSFQSWHILFSYLFIKDAISNPNPLINSAFLFGVGVVLIKSICIGQSVSFAIKNQNLNATFSVFVLAAILLTPTGSVYSLILLICILPELIGQKAMPQFQNLVKNPKVLLIPIIIFLICNIQFHTNENLPLFFRFSRLFLLLTLWFLLFKRSDFQWVYSVSAFVLFSPGLLKLNLFNEQKDRSSYFPIQQERGIISKFLFDGQNFKYWFRDAEGFHKKTQPYITKSIDSQSVYVLDNRIFKGKTLILNSPDQKENPVLIDGKIIVYLSSKQRGPGFFALRQISVDGAN